QFLPLVVDRLGDLARTAVRVEVVPSVGGVRLPDPVARDRVAVPVAGTGGEQGRGQHGRHRCADESGAVHRASSRLCVDTIWPFCGYVCQVRQTSPAPCGPVAGSTTTAVTASGEPGKTPHRLRSASAARGITR